MSNEYAADPAEDHKTPGGNPQDEKQPEQVTTETTIETPGGTEVTETTTEADE